MDFAGLERRIRAIEATRPASFRWGEVVAVDEGAGTARVKIHDADGMVSMPLRVGQSRTNKDQEQHLPDLGEHVGCLFSGQGLEEGMVMAAVYSTAHPSPGKPAHVWYRKFADGTELEYDRETHKLTGTIKGDVDLTVEKDILVKCDQKVTLDAKDDVLLKSGKSIILEGAVSIILRTPSLIIQGLFGKVCSALMTATFKLKGLLDQEGDHKLTGDVDAGGKIIDSGGNTNHHSH